MLISFLIIAKLLQIITAAATTTCYNRIYDDYPYFSTKTAYENVHGNFTRLHDSCQPIQIWMLTRHGTRYPDKDIISTMQNLSTLKDQILENHQQGKGLLCEYELNYLRHWKLNSNVHMKNARILTDQGKKQLHKLAIRLKQIFGDLLDTKNIKPNDFIFRSTDTQRTQESMNNFYRGIFEKDETTVKPVTPPQNDTLLLAYDFCPAWTSGYVNDYVSAEQDKFTVRFEVQNLLQNVGRRLGFNREIDFPTIQSIYDACRFETAWHPNRTSPWCLIFRRDELQILEYRQDLDYYYFAGPGRPMSAKIGCNLLSDMFEHFKTLASGNFTNQPRGIFYFAHTVTLQTFMSALKIYEETKPLLATNYADADIQNRYYRTSFLGPFATNVVAVFYRCSQLKNQYKVMFYTAERLVEMSGCQDGICDWEFLEQKYTADVNKCSMDFCYEKNDNNSAVRATLKISKFMSGILLVVVSARTALSF